MSDRLPHVCFIAPNAFPLLSGDASVELIGGAELQQVIVARLLAARGYRVSMICHDFGQADSLEIDGIQVVRAHRPDAGLPVLRYIWPRLTSIWGCLRRVDADIYYQRAAGKLTGVMAAFCRRHGKKSVFAAAGNPDLVRNTPRIRYARDRWIYSLGLRHVDRIFVQNEEQAQLCRENVGREAIQVPNCYIAPNRRSVGREGDRVLWVSTIRKLKRPELFLDLAEALPDHGFRMIGGPGGGEHALYESISKRAGVMKNVEFLGFVPYSQTDQLFDRAVLFVNTSDSEGFPNTFLQAWARGIPTVSFVDSGARLEREPIGFRVESMDEMVAAVDKLASDGAARLQAGRRCAAYFESHHSPEHVVRLYERLFQNLFETGSDRTT
jgi:glycosyltransferase involved in cell wall biosynthesis